MAHEGIVFKGSKDYRDFKIEESTRHKLKNECGYEVKNEYYLLLSKPEYIHLVLLLTLGKKSSTMPKKLKNKFSSLPDGERATINAYFNINQKRKQFILPDSFEGYLQPFKYHQILFEMFYKQFNQSLVEGFFEQNMKGKLRIRQANTLANFYAGLKASSCENQDIFLMHHEANQLLLICFSDKPRNNNNVKQGSSISMASRLSEIISDEPESEIKQKKEIKEGKEEKLERKGKPGKLQQQGEVDDQDDEEEEQKVVQVKALQQSAADYICTAFLLIVLAIICVFLLFQDPEKSFSESISTLKFIEFISNLKVLNPK